MVKNVCAAVVGLLLLSACSLAGSEQDACNAGGALFYDDFSGAQDCGWREYNQSGTVAEIDEESQTLRISTGQPGQISWTHAGRAFNDVIITTQATQAGGPDDNAYGVICRYQDENNFYVFLISGDGYYAIGKYQTGEPNIIYLTADQKYIASEAINQGNDTNQLRISCVGNELGLQVNGVPLLTVTDPTFVRGDVGVAASTMAPGTAVIQFDNFQVIAP